MAPSDSYDPLTWKPDGSMSAAAPARAAQAVVSDAEHPPPPWLPLALSAAILLGGAALAFASRDGARPAPGVETPG